MRITRQLGLFTGWLLAAAGLLRAADLPLELRQNNTPNNLRSQRGVPISATVGNPAGSDGRMPVGLNDSGSYTTPTVNQFAGHMPFSGGTAPTNAALVKASARLRGTNVFSAQVAAEMQLPRVSMNGGGLLVQRRVLVGAPFVGRQSSLSFGSIVAVPNTDERGTLLSGVLASGYWLPEPYGIENGLLSGYYWSPHARKVFAIQPGPLRITWRKAAAYTASTVPASYVNPGGPVSFETNGTSIYLLYTDSQIVSGSSVKHPRKMYWTEREYRLLGKPVSIPPARIGGVNIVYNNNFPRNVELEYRGPGYTSPTEGGSNQGLSELRTLWYDQSQGFLYAYNQEGRVFVEILGDARPDGQTRVHLGFEIVDVIRQPNPADVGIELGERITPPFGSADDLTPDPILQAGSPQFGFKHTVAGNNRQNLYAQVETRSLNDYLVHWLEDGEMDIQWPTELGRYRLYWPVDPAKYSHYIRPAVSTDAEAKKTAVQLDAQNIPLIAYQDPLDRPRATLTADTKFYTFLDTAHGAHRTLLRFIAGEQIAFERVFSWLDTTLGSESYTGTVATNLPDIGVRLAYPRAYAAYTNYQAYLASSTNYANYLANVTRGVNGDWDLKFYDYDPADNGSVVSWQLFVVSTNLTTGVRSTNIFNSTGGSTIVYAPTTPVLNRITVSGVVGAVQSVYVRMNGFAHAYPSDIVVALSAPNGGSVFLVNRQGGANGVSGLTMEFDDAAAGMVGTPFASGTFKPALNQMAGLLYAMPAPVGLPDNVPFAADPGAPPATLASSGSSFWTDLSTVPRVVDMTAIVGERLSAPDGEPESTANWAYLPGHIHKEAGIGYHPGAYLDPFEVGFEQAAKGAIIPVNAVPGTNTLQVWWYRPNSRLAGLNAGDNVRGFSTVYWPSVLGRYTLAYPSNPPEIVLASKLGSGTLDSIRARGTIYSQNNRALPGYNPNEEHAVMSGGMAYATRDDLNITTGTNFSSRPFVLLDYVAADGRPAMTAFKVLREKPEAGYVFDYIAQAGQMVQPPPPLTFLAKPVLGSGDSAVSYNTEPSHSGGDLPGNWNAARDASGPFAHYGAFTYRDRHHDFWVYRGAHAGIPALQAGSLNPISRTFGPLGSVIATVGARFEYRVFASREEQYLTIVAPQGLPSWLDIQGLKLVGTPGASDAGSGTYQIVVEDLYDHTRVTNSLSLTVSGSLASDPQPIPLLRSTNVYTGTVTDFTDRPPFLAASPTPSNSFTMRYYYKTEPSFDWPGIANPPAPGSIVPYLRPINPANGQYIGDPASKDTASLEIVYRPVWPVRDPKDSTKPLPSLAFGATLTVPAFNLPGVKDMKTARVLYQQSVAGDVAVAKPSVFLHDGTREKEADFAEVDLAELPASVRKDYYQGRYFFPNLPPHLADRVFFDPNRGEKGRLVLSGRFVQETLGESYLMLNVLRGSDLAAVLALCADADNDKAKWNLLVNGLRTPLETFHENPAVPGSYIPNAPLTQSIPVGDLAVVKSDNTAVVSYALSATGPGSGYVTLVESGGTAFTRPGDPVALHVFKVDGSAMYPGEVKVLTAANPLSELVTFQHTSDLAGRYDEFEYEWKIAAPVDGLPPVADAQMTRYLSLFTGTNQPFRTIGGAGIQALADNYVVMRYRPKSASHPLYNQWSSWTSPKLAEGWIKRVLAGINPFNQRVGNLFNNAVNTDASILAQAGKRWEGDVALNLDTMDNYGLIEIYETVLRRAKSLSIEAGYNYGPANDALLLAAGYLNDLYMMLGNEAWADAANPTIGIGTKDSTYGDIATALFSFKGQVPSLLEEELALLRGRDDFLLPGVQVSPIYNRLVWNYTRGIDSGEVIYALNYNIQENPNKNPDGVVDASDAAAVYPQGHGDAYGHYLTALKGYYTLLMNSKFDWVPRIEAVNVLGQPVSVDYQDERKFAAAATAVARAGQQIVDLTWRRDYQAVSKVGWNHLAESRSNPQRVYTSPTATNAVTRYWGLDHWATRSGQGAFLNWVVGNAMLPEVDPDPLHEGIQKIDRSTVTELVELVTLSKAVQTSLDNAESGLSPLGVTENGIAFDINPNAITGTEGGSHFEQIYGRAKTALNNAVASFDDAKDVTRLMRSEQDSLADLQTKVADQEHAFKNALIELYGTPYPEDIGAGKTFPQGYTGPDLLHYMYVDLKEFGYQGSGDSNGSETFKIDLQAMPGDWMTRIYTDVDFVTPASSSSYSTNHYVEYVLGSHGFYGKPATWIGKRRAPGKLQQAASEIIAARTRLQAALNDAVGAKEGLDKAIQLFKADIKTHDDIRKLEKDLLIAEQTQASVEQFLELTSVILDHTKESIKITATTAKDSLPTSLIAGLAAGGDLTAPARGALAAAGFVTTEVIDWEKIVQFIAVSTLGFANDTAARWTQFDGIAPLEWKQELRGAVADLADAMGGVQDAWKTINELNRSYDDAQRRYRALVAEGDRIQEHREILRRRSSAIVQGFRTRDAAFRLFRNEKLERYKTLFDLAARYSLLAANAYDYETGLLDTSAGRAFRKRIINSRALGVVRNGEPLFGGSNTGDPGLSSTLAEMKADWDVLKGRLGINNPDAYGTTVSLRTEKLRILPTTDGDTNWKDVLQNARVRNLLDDGDVRRYCMQINNGDGLPVPGIVVTFSTTIADGLNLFGRELAAGDHNFSPSAFATKIFGVGVALDGYRGMDNPTANSTATSGTTSPSDPGSWFIDPLALAATPHIYLIPVGVDAMRSPPLEDSNTIRTWNVEDVAIPLPFNIGGSDIDDEESFLSAGTLTEPLFTPRKHQAFRPVSSTAVFSPNLYGAGGTLQRTQFTNNRLVGRSVWNSQWKLVIPGRALLNDPNEGLDRFVQTVKDIKLHFVTYSYSGN
jgi:subtilisin-like proprotein convertase family protein